MEPQNNPYDFIMNPQSPKKSLFLGGGDKKTKIFQMIILLGIVVLVFGGFLLFLRGNSNKNSQQILQAAAIQKDIFDMIESNQKNIRSQKLINDSTTAMTIINGQSYQLTEYMNKHGLKKQTKKIKALQNDQYKKLLQDALANGKFEETYTALLSNKLDEYRSLLRNIYGSTNNKALKNLTSNYYDQLSIIMAKS